MILNLEIFEKYINSSIWKLQFKMESIANVTNPLKPNLLMVLTN